MSRGMAAHPPFQWPELRGVPQEGRTFPWWSSEQRTISARAVFWKLDIGGLLTRSAHTPASMSSSFSGSSTPFSWKTWWTEETVETSSGCGSISVLATAFSCFWSVWSKGVPDVVAYRWRAVLKGLCTVNERPPGCRELTRYTADFDRASRHAKLIVVRPPDEVTRRRVGRLKERAGPERSMMPIDI